MPFAGWNEAHELRAVVRCVPRRDVLIDADGLVRAAGYTRTPTCLTGEPFRLRVAGARRDRAGTAVTRELEAQEQIPAPFKN